MASVTVTGSIGGTNFFFPTSTTFQTALAQQILSSAFSSSTTELATGSGGPITSAQVVDTSSTGSVLTGASSIPSAQIALGGQDGLYVTGGSTLSTVVAADNSNSSVVNDNPNGGLIAATGAGGNALLALAGASNFTTGISGQDIVYLDGAANSLTSDGSDGVLVGGPSTVTAAPSGLDNILLTSGTTLAFINGSASGTDSITGAPSATVVLAGTGSTSISSGVGPETFYVDTSAGNVTLNGNLQPTDTFQFVKNAGTSTANVMVNNFASGDAVDVHGYAGFNITAAAGNPAGSMLQLSDGSQVTFSNLSVAVLQQTVKTV